MFANERLDGVLDVELDEVGGVCGGCGVISLVSISLVLFNLANKNSFAGAVKSKAVRLSLRNQFSTQSMQLHINCKPSGRLCSLTNSNVLFPLSS